MARLPRPYLPDCPQHIIQRGNNREACFGGESDYVAYLHHLKIAADKLGVWIHAFVLMTNHVHLLATPADESGIGGMMQSLGRRYVRYFNYMYTRTGKLWEGRCKATLVDSDAYLFTVYRYIELNPVRAAMVAHAGEYPWSSYQHNAVGRHINLITPHRQYITLGKTSEERQSSYWELFAGTMTEAELQAIRDATNKAWLFGSDRFKRDFESRTVRSADPRTRGGDRRSKRWRTLNQRV